MLESGGEKTQPVPQKQRKNACMAVLLLTIVIAVGGCVGEMGFDGIIGGGHMINNAYAEESVLLVTNETAKLTASDGANNDYFGRSVSIYNNTAVIGAFLDDSGSAYVFEYSSGNWTQKQKLTASDGAEDDRFGYSVSLYNNTAVIGAHFDVDNDIISGSAYVFEYSSGTWTQKQKLTASDGEGGDQFGHSVSVYNNTAVIGAYGDDDNSKTDSGSAYVFEKNSTGHWMQKQKLTASDAAAGDRFGWSVSVYNSTAVIGAFYDDDNSKTDSGSAYVFEKNSTSGNWTQKQKITASDGVTDNYFGHSVSIYNNTAVIGAFYDDDNSKTDSGSAYVFEKNSTSGNWTQKQKLTASDAAEDDRFGRSVSVYNSTAIIGASRDDSGSAYVFEYSSGNWTQKEKLTASDAAASDRFGWSVSVYNSTAIIGASRDDSGSAYVFTILQAPTAHAGDDQTVDEGGITVTLDGTGSADPNGDIITYAWSQTQGPTVTLSSSTSESPMFTTPTVTSEQTLTFSLTVNDGAVNSTPDTVDITIQNTINESPTAHAGDDRTVDKGADVTLDGTGSADPNGDTLTYAWSQTQSPTVTLSSSTSESPTFTPPTVTSEQTLTFSLTVNDGAVDSTPDTVDITVSNVKNETAKLTASDGAAKDYFGRSVSIYNNTAIIGAYGDDSGSAYVFEYSSGTWTQKQKLTASDAAGRNWFGHSVSVYNNTAVIGAHFDDDNGKRSSGSAYVFEKNSSGTWTQKQKLTASDGAEDDRFGRSVSVYNNTAVIGAFLDNDNGKTDSGSAYIFEYSSGTWTQKQKLTASDAATRDWFGWYVSVYNNTAVIGAFLDDDNGRNSGSAYIFEYSSGTWTQKQKLTASDGAEDDRFGTSVSVYNSTAVIGAVYDDDNSKADSGSAYVFEKNSSGTWTQKQKLTASDGAAGDYFSIVSIYNNTAVIGAVYDDDNGINSGSAYVFEKNSSGNWTQKEKLTASDGAEDDAFGTSVSVYNNTAVIGAVYDDDNGINSGSAYVFTISANQTPTAHAGADQTVDEGTDVTLDGTGSADPNDDAITYAWSQTQGPTVTLSSSISASPMFTTPTVNSEQTLTFSLTVNDGAVDSTPDTVDITIQNTINESPTANAGADQTVSEGDNVTLDGTGSADPNDDAITYAWSQTQGPTVTLSSSISASPMFTTPTVNSEQTLTFSLTVNDGAVDSTPDTVDITIQNTINESPTANAGADQTVSEGTTDIQLNGSATDPDTDDTITYLWSQTQGPTVTLSSSTSASPTFDAPAVNSNQAILTFSLTVNDGTVDSTPDTVDITVLDTDDVLLTSSGSPLGSSGGGGSGSSSGIGTSGGGGGSGSSSGIGTSGGGRGSSTWVDNVYLKSVSWDCNAGTIKIIAGPDSDYISVAVHTTQLGIHQASIAGDDIPGYRAFVSPMHKTEDYINIKAVALSGRNLVTISESIDVDACVGERTYHAPDDSTTTTIKQPVPKQEDDKDRLADFVDPKKNPQYYIDRYNNEIEYREWFDENYPGITIYDAVGLPVPDPTLEPAVEQEPTAVEQEPAMKQEPEPICDPRAELVDGFCIPVTPRPEENGGGCLIATAAYGTELAPQVQLLREIRDNTVLQTQSGSAFMDSFNSFYYSFSPSIADLERQNPVFREAVKMAVTPLISSLAILDYVDIDSESEMLGYGIGIVAMNIAMYVALPVSALYYVRRLVA